MSQLIFWYPEAADLLYEVINFRFSVNAVSSGPLGLCSFNSDLSNSNLSQVMLTES